MPGAAWPGLKCQELPGLGSNARSSLGLAQKANLHLSVLGLEGSKSVFMEASDIKKKLSLESTLSKKTR